MNARKNKKVLIALSSVMALGTLGAVLVFSHSEDSLSRAGSGVSSSIVFTRDGAFTKIDDTTASVSGQSYTGATYYAVSRNNGDITDTNYVGQFGMGRAYDEQYITFSTGATDTSDFTFQAVTGIKVTTTSASNQNLYVYFGSGFSDSVQVVANSNPSKITFSSPLQKLRLGTATVQGRNITRIELFYECGGEPEPATPDHIAVYNATTLYEFGDSFVKPEVRMIFSDKSTEVIPSEKVTCTGYDMETLGEQTVTVSAEYDSVLYETTYKITVYIPTLYSISYNMLDASIVEYVNIHDYIDDVDALPPSFEEGSDVEMEIILSTNTYEVVYLSIEEDESWDSFSTVDSVNFTLTDLPNKNITLTIWIAPVE